MASSGSIIGMSNTDRRAAVIGSIRQHLKASVPFDQARTHHTSTPPARAVALAPVDAQVSLIDVFCANLALVGGVSTVVKSEADAADEVRRIVSSLGAARIAVSDAPLVDRVASALTASEVKRDASKGWLFDSHLGITSAQWAIAETGTLVLESSAENHRLISLVPPAHLCIVRAESIVASMGDVLSSCARDLSPLVTFVTGASRTSDIELTLAIGVHGPEKLFVIVIDNAG